MTFERADESCFIGMTSLLSLIVTLCLGVDVHPKTLFEIAMALFTISVSFPSKSRFSATFSILLRFEGFWNLGLSTAFPTNSEDIQYVCGTVRVTPALTFFRVF